MEEIVGIAGVVIVGLMVGVEFAVAAIVNPIFDRLPSDSLAARSDGARVLGRVMPFWYFGSLGISAAAGALMWGERMTWSIGAAGGLLMVSIVMSLMLLVPINSQLARIDDGAGSPDANAAVRRWDKLHYVRVVIIIAAFVFLTVGVAA